MEIDNKTVGIACITFLEAIALFSGIDGVLLASAIGAIASIVGYQAGKNGLFT